MRKLRKALATFLSFLMCFSLFANVAHAEEPVFIDSSNDAIVSDEDIVSEDEYSEDIDVISDENVDVVGALTDQSDYEKARKYWNKLKQRLKEEGSQLVTKCHQLKMTAQDGKKRTYR